MVMVSQANAQASSLHLSIPGKASQATLPAGSWQLPLQRREREREREAHFFSAASVRPAGMPPLPGAASATGNNPMIIPFRPSCPVHSHGRHDLLQPAWALLPPLCPRSLLASFCLPRAAYVCGLLAAHVATTRTGLCTVSTNTFPPPHAVAPNPPLPKLSNVPHD